MSVLLLLNNLDKIEKKKKATNLLCTVTRYGPQSVASASGVNLLRWNDVSRASRIFLPQSCNVSSIFECNPKRYAVHVHLQCNCPSNAKHK